MVELSCRDEDLQRLCREAADELDSAYRMKPRKLGKEVDFAETRIVRLRDCLITRLRRGNGSQDALRWRPVLDRVNMALSFVVSVEYPVRAIHRKHLEEARKILNDVSRQVK